MSSIGSVLGGIAGTAIGGPIGGSIGSSLGASLGGSIAGEGGSEGVAGQASSLQEAKIEEAINKQDQALEIIREDLDPFLQEGKQAVTGLADLITNPEAQKEFITQNPFFDALAGRAEQDLFKNQAAKGKVGSGGTAEALQNSLLLLGSDLLQQNQQQRLGLSSLGANVGTNIGSFTQTGASNIGNLLVGQGAVQAAGVAGQGVEQQGVANSILGGLGGFGGFGGGGVTSGGIAGGQFPSGFSGSQAGNTAFAQSKGITFI